MNENEIQNDIENTAESTADFSGIRSDTDTAPGMVHTDQAGEDSAQTNDNVIQGDSYSENNVNSDDDTNALTGNSGSTVFTLEANPIDYTETLTQIQDEITEVNSVISVLNNVVWLLFIFLLITWAEKKITVYVNRMTRERR